MGQKAHTVPPGFELGSLDSDSRVLTIAPWNQTLLWALHILMETQDWESLKAEPEPAYGLVLKKRLPCSKDGLWAQLTRLSICCTWFPL